MKNLADLPDVFDEIGAVYVMVQGQVYFIGQQQLIQAVPGFQQLRQQMSGSFLTSLPLVKAG